MARGQKYNDDLKEKAFALLAVNNSVSLVAKELGLPRSTVKSWKEDYDKKAEISGEPTIANLRQENKKRFVADAWRLIDKTKTLLERRLDRALTNEDELDELLDEICKLDNKELSNEQRKAMYQKVKSLKLEQTKELAVVLGTLYDKQALANKEATAIIEGDITVKKFEDF